VPAKNGVEEKGARE